MTDSNILTSGEVIKVLRASNKQLIKEKRKAEQKLESHKKQIVELQKLVKDKKEYDKLIIKSENILQDLENKIRTREAELKELKEANLADLGMLQRKQRLEQMESQLQQFANKIKEREAKLFEVDSKVRHLRELEDSINMMAENILKRADALRITLEQLASFHSRTLTPSP